MSLQESLRELVATRGVRVTAEAAEFRGALDDFLAEDEATTGEVNLLVDAVRLGGLERLLALLDHGASPEAAVAEAGAGLARDRGSDDDRRSRWAVAVLGYAVGRLDVSAVPTHGVEEPAAAATPGGVDVQDARGTISLPGALGTQGAPGVPESEPTALRQQPPPPQPPPPAPPAPARRRGPGLLILAIALVLGLVAGVGFAVWETQRGDDAADGSGDSSDSSGSGGPGAAIPDNEILVPYRDEAGGLRIYEVDADTGEWTELTDGNTDDLPAVSPDRTQVTFLVKDDAGVPVLTSLRVGSDEAPAPVFPADGPCAHALRPGWSLDGARFAIVCTGDDFVTDGIFVCDSDGGNAEEVLTGEDFRGSPTWVDEDTFVYGRDDPDTGADTLWTYDVPGNDSTQLQLPDDPEAHLTHADWSDAAQKLLFLVHGDDDVYGHLWVGGLDLQDAQQLGETEYAHPVWSPDGTRIAAIWRDPEDGGAQRLVVVDPADPDNPTVLADLSPQPNGTPTIPVWASR